MLPAGFKFRDQVILGGGYEESTYLTNTCTGIHNVLKGGCWTVPTGSVAWITIHGGMRWGIVNGDIVNDVLAGTYYRYYGGSDRGVVNGTITNNFGQELAEGEAAPELIFTNKGSGTSTNIGFTYGGGLEDTDFPAKIAAALAVEESERTNIQKMYAALADGLEDGQVYNVSTEAIVNNIYYGTFRQFYGGPLGLNTAGVTSNIGSVTNNVYGGTFNDTTIGSTTHHAYFGGAARNVTFAEGVTNNIYGGVFNTNYYGGTPGSGKVVCPSIENHFYGGQGCSTNKHMFLGNGAPTYTGTVHNVFYAPDDTYPGFDAKRSYVYGGCTNIHNNTEAEFGVINEIRGGTFIGFWGLGGGSSMEANTNVKTVVTGGTFLRYDNSNLRNAIAGATRNGEMNGNAVLEISGGTFHGAVVGGVIYGSADAAADLINGNITVTIKGGEFLEGIYGVNKPGTSVALAEGKTCTVSVIQTEGKSLLLGGDAKIDSFEANGSVFDITANTNLVIDSVTGTLKAQQTEGWLAKDYIKMPAETAFEITTAEAAYGSYKADETILVRGNALNPMGATLRLADRLGVRIVLNPDDVDLYEDVFTYKVSMGGTVLASGTYEDIKANQYSILFEGIGLGQFGETFTVTSPVMEDLEQSIAGLATLAQTAWAGNAKWKAYADAVIEFHNVYNLDATNTLEPAAVENKTEFSKGTGFVSGNATLLMSDAAGIRLTVTLDAAPTNAKFTVGELEFEATVTENTVTADIFVAHEYMDEIFTINVVSDAGTHLTCTTSIEAMANELASDESNENRNNAIAFLVYAQKAVACK